jgi:hypothetical protein
MTQVPPANQQTQARSGIEEITLRYNEILCAVRHILVPTDLTQDSLRTIRHAIR